MTPRAAPLVVVDGLDVMTRAAPLLEAAGWNVSWTLHAEPEPWDLSPLRRAVVGVAATARDVAAAVAAAVRGAAVVSHAVEDEHRALLVDDLCSVGNVSMWTSATAPRSAGLDAEQLRLLQLLAEGWSVADAAGALHLSRRTAVRRLAAAREVLEVATNAEALVVVGADLDALRPERG